MTERFKRAYDALYNAWETGTLAKGTCMACAVGNIIAARARVQIPKEAISPDRILREKIAMSTERELSRLEFPALSWGLVFWTGPSGIQNRNFGKYPDIEYSVKKLTDYTVTELAQVEYAFETNAKIFVDRYDNYSAQELEEDQFNGLMAVMDVLIQLDEVQEGQQYKDTFKRKLEAHCKM